MLHHRRLGEILRQLCRQKGVDLVEGNTTSDHVHMILSVPPKFSISMVIGYMKGKSGIQIHREFQGSKRGFTGKHFWSRGYCVSTVGLDEKKIREYVQHQKKMEQQAELNFQSKPLLGAFLKPPAMQVVDDSSSS